MKINSKNVVAKLLIMVFFGISNPLNAQDKSVVLKPFKIIIGKTENGIKMTCKSGCGWQELEFTFGENKPQAIDEYGMTDVDINSSRKDPNLSDMLFTLIVLEDKIILKGIDGTAWKDLNFQLSNNELKGINQFGMTQPD